MTDALTEEKLRAEAMGREAGHIKYFYWFGYQMALAGRHQDEDAILVMIGAEAPNRDAEGRGYRDGRAWVAEAKAKAPVTKQPRRGTAFGGRFRFISRAWFPSRSHND